MSSIDCESILGVVSLPCCNFFQVQQYFMGQLPTFESVLFMAPNYRFADSAIWSEKNTVRVWVKPEIRWVDNYRPFIGDTVRNRVLFSCL